MNRMNSIKMADKMMDEGNLDAALKVIFNLNNEAQWMTKEEHDAIQDVIERHDKLTP